jgi:hypothetical protein
VLNPLERAGVSVGNIDGVKLSIPNNYLLSGLLYKGEEQWSMARRTFTPSFDSEIENFAIVVRQSTLQPIQSAQDRSDFIASHRTAYTPPEKKWISVAFTAKPYRFGGGTLRKAFEGNIKDEAHWGPFIRQADDVYGLGHHVSPQKYNHVSGQIDELFFDEKKSTSFIECENTHRRVAPFDALIFCDHYFVLPEIRAVASVHYTDRDVIARWREVEAEITKIAHSFVVQ